MTINYLAVVCMYIILYYTDVNYLIKFVRTTDAEIIEFKTSALIPFRNMTFKLIGLSTSHQIRLKIISHVEEDLIFSGIIVDLIIYNVITSYKTIKKKKRPSMNL